MASGVSVSTEIGCQRAVFSPDTWTWEIRPIVDKRLGRWYFAFNPALERSWHGPSAGQGLAFSPNFKASYDVTRNLQVGLEYYGNMGDITGFDPLYQQQQHIVPSIDYNLGPNWEFNFGVGVGMTRATDHLLVKAVIGPQVSVRYAQGHRCLETFLALNTRHLAGMAALRNSKLRRPGQTGNDE
jgi:hypothetical protein